MVSTLKVTWTRPGCWGYWSGDIGDRDEMQQWDRDHESDCPVPAPPSLRKYQSAIDDVLAIARSAEHECLRREEPVWPIPTWIGEVRVALDRRDDHCDCNQCADAPRRIKNYRGIEVDL